MKQLLENAPIQMQKMAQNPLLRITARTQPTAVVPTLVTSRQFTVTQFTALLRDLLDMRWPRVPPVLSPPPPAFFAFVFTAHGTSWVVKLKANFADFLRYIHSLCLYRVIRKRACASVHQPRADTRQVPSNIQEVIIHVEPRSKRASHVRKAAYKWPTSDKNWLGIFDSELCRKLYTARHYLPHATI